MPNDDLSDELVIEWNHYAIVDEHRIRVSFTAGPSECWGTRAVVRETNKRVQIAVVQGTVPWLQIGEECSAEVREATLLIETEFPIAAKKVVPWADPPFLHSAA